MLPQTPHQPTSRAQEPLRRRVYVAVCLLAAAALLVIVLTDLRRGQVEPGTAAGLALCLGVAGLLQFSRLPWLLVDYTVLLGASGIVVMQLLHLLGTQEPIPLRTYFPGVFLVIAAFSVLPVRAALAYTAALLAIFAGLSVATGSDVVLLGELTLASLLIAHLSYFGRQVSAERARSEEQYRLSRTDVLTGLENRRGMYERIQQAFSRSLNSEGAEFTVMLADIDYFKRVNDTFGHDVGDQVLQRVASVLQREVGHQGSVARWGGEEFLILLETSEAPVVRAVAGQVWHAVRTAAVMGLPAVTTSLGVASSGEVVSVSDLLRIADGRLYQAKDAGRDRVQLGPALYARAPSDAAGKPRPVAAAPASTAPREQNL
ncbi:GGDEF domain-containing protein [Deinococcus sp. A31D244]|uniref:GGDEF domain-containing protein n=1 Tax=Deinococcus sp. A31D244 TaxID=3397675 RepID=UPI0039E0B53B